MEQNLRVAVGSEDAATPTQLGPQILKVVDLAIEDNDQRTSLIDHWLISGGEIDDRQPQMGQPNPRIGPEPIAIRSTMGHDTTHGTQRLLIDPIFSKSDYTSNATHSN